MLEPYNHKIESKRSKMKEYEITYQLQNGEVGHTYCTKNVKAEMQAIKELSERVNNPVVAISYTRLR